MVGEGAAHIVLLTVSAFDKLLELGDNGVEAPPALVVYPETVIYFFPAVQTEDNI